MPFSNQYNRSVANKVIANAKRDIATKDKMCDDPASCRTTFATRIYVR